MNRDEKRNVSLAYMFTLCESRTVALRLACTKLCSKRASPSVYMPSVTSSPTLEVTLAVHGSMSPVSKPPLMSNSLLIPLVVIVEEVVLSLMVLFICKLGVSVAEGEPLLVDEETLPESSDTVTGAVATDDDKELVREEEPPPIVVREAVKMAFDMLLAAEEGTT